MGQRGGLGIGAKGDMGKEDMWGYVSFQGIKRKYDEAKLTTKQVANMKTKLNQLNYIILGEEDSCRCELKLRRKYTSC